MTIVLCLPLFFYGVPAEGPKQQVHSEDKAGPQFYSALTWQTGA